MADSVAVAQAKLMALDIRHTGEIPTKKKLPCKRLIAANQVRNQFAEPYNNKYLILYNLKKKLLKLLGYADEEDRHATEAETLQNHQQGHQKPKRSGFMSPSPEIHDIVDDNLAADFDGSLSGLGVDIHAASFSMSEALNALPNLSISSSQIFKQEIPSPAHHNNSNELKNEQTNGSAHGKKFLFLFKS